MKISYSKKDFKTYDDGNSKKWMLGNGLGGFSSISIINSQFRKHDGYLVTSTNMPLDRKMGLVKTSEIINVNGNIYDLDCQRYVNGIKEGYLYLSEFTFDEIPSYRYDIDGVCIKKEISPEYNKNAVGIKYTIETLNEATIEIIPFYNLSKLGEIDEDYDNNNFQINKKMITVYNNLETVYLTYSTGNVIENKEKFTNEIIYDYDYKNGDSRLGKNYKPVSIIVKLKKGQKKVIEISASLEKKMNSASKIIYNNKERIKDIILNSLLDDELAISLTKSADNFVCFRKSTNLKTILAGFPWFTDWGRDTMIAFTGILLVPRRFEEAREVLKSFMLYQKNGLIPNMFPDTDKDEPLYNTVDASLWYFYAVFKYLEYTKDYDFIKKEIYPTLKEIIKWYMEGTDFSIKMEDDYLISAGSNLDQVTWMDVRVNGIVVTPRHGKPVEINALWYNALRIINDLTIRFDESAEIDYYSMAENVKKSFIKFYNKEKKCLYDVIDEYDDSIRPNMLYAVSLPYKLLPESIEKEIVDKCYMELYNFYGMRSLSKFDERFKKVYEGELLNRDFSYHMGTTWGFLLGTFIESYYYVYKSVDKIKEFIDLAKGHLYDGCIYGFAEIFDGEVVRDGKGCYNQAWSVGELLRVYYEILL